MISLERVVRRNGKIATLRVSRKQHNCAECPVTIGKEQEYYEIVIGGGGLGSLKFPERAHPGCLESNLRR